MSDVFDLLKKMPGVKLYYSDNEEKWCCTWSKHEGEETRAYGETPLEAVEFIFSMVQSEKEQHLYEIVIIDGQAYSRRKSKD